MADYIPTDDDDLNTFITETFVPTATANATTLGLTPAEITALTAAATAWSYAFTAHTNAQSAAQSAVIDKNAKRESIVALIRAASNKIQANPAVSDTLKELLGLTVRKTTRTPSPVPTTPPAMSRIDTSTRAILRLFVVDSTTPDSRAKPAGVASCEIREQIGGTQPTDPNGMSLLAVETRFPYRADFEQTDIGKTAFFAMRWLNTRGQFGPWSQVYSAIIPS